MEKYIPLDVLLAEIKRLDALYHTSKDLSGGLFIQGLFCFLYTLEVKEVDLEKEIKDYFDNQPIITKSKGINYQLIPSGEEIAKHFFELGLKTQNKITPLQQQRISVMKMEFWTGLQTFNESEMTLSDAYNKGIEDVLEELGLKAQKGE